ncbi:MAG: vanadium-dependent haloperoxidase [Cytophagales bacterium]|nr:vanadium-dependent haloperoxidase [Cytophagales bacterium]
MKKTHFTLMITLLAALVVGCSPDESDENQDIISSKDASISIEEVGREWMKLQLKLTKETPGFTPPVAARAFGYTSLALYEAVQAGAEGYQSLSGQLNGLSLDKVSIGENDRYHWGVVANSALAEIVRKCYDNSNDPKRGEHMSMVDSLEAHFEAVFLLESSQEIVNDSKAYALTKADLINEYAHGDGQSECFKTNFPNYTPPSGHDSLWVPTVDGQKALQPYWGDVRPFLVVNSTMTMPKAPPAFSLDSTSAFWKDVKEVYDSSINLSVERETIAKYWSDDPGKTATPPGHSVSILEQILEKENSNLIISAEAYARIGMGVHDAFISCWKAKYAYNLVRPVTLLRKYIDANYAAPLNTPAFPEYTSGHSVQSGASAKILTDLFGENYSFTDRTHEGRSDIDGSPREFSSFDHFANEAAISRLYGGIHYRCAIEEGVSQGKKIGFNIGQLKFKK